MGLGDVYLGAPVATPLDPRHRLVTTKYNPARTWTPENAVGIGGAYLCVYGMEGPGGYQFVGRTVQMWNRWRQTADFPRWQALAAAFLRPAALLSREWRGAVAAARGLPAWPLPAACRSGDAAPGGLSTFPRRQRGIDRGLPAAAADGIRCRTPAPGAKRASPRRRWLKPRRCASKRKLPAGSEAVYAPVTGSLWQLRAQVGQKVAADEELLVMEAMKMEISVRAPVAGSGSPPSSARPASRRRPATCCSPSKPVEHPHDAHGPSPPCARRISPGRQTPRQTVEEVLARIERRADNPIWISRRGRSCVARARRAAANAGPRAAAVVWHPLRHQGQHRSRGTADHRGLPGVCLSAGRECRGPYRKLIDAGAIAIGKTNLDQFATGLVGTRSPYGIVRNSFDARYISGGSSSGSARGRGAGPGWAFALGTDTGRFRTRARCIQQPRRLQAHTGCDQHAAAWCRRVARSMPISIFALTAGDAAQVAEVMRGPDPGDPWSRAGVACAGPRLVAPDRATHRRAAPGPA